METTQVNVGSLKSKAKTLKDIHFVISYDMDAYLPSHANCNSYFLKKILNG